MNTIAVYPGSFDPITNGHLDVIRRAAGVFDTVVVGVLANPRKTPLLPVETRIRVIRDALTEAGGVARRHRGRASFDGLTVDFCRARGAGFIVRGLRAISDFEVEMQLAHNNRVLAPDVDTVFFMTSVEQRLRQLEPGQGDRRGSAATSLDGPGRRPDGPRRGTPEALTARPRAILAATRARDHPPSREGTPIDIIFLVERLESLIANGKKLPLTTNVVVDQNAALGLIDELRVAVPEEVRAAKRINAEGERIIEKAQDEAERIVAKAQEQAAFLIDERGLTQPAEADEPARDRRARTSDADEIRRGADEYAVGVLVGLEGDVVRTLQSIKKGIAMLDERRADLVAGRRRRSTWTTAAGPTSRRTRRSRPAHDRAARRTGRSSGTSPGSWPMPSGPTATYPVHGRPDRPARRTSS